MEQEVKDSIFDEIWKSKQEVKNKYTLESIFYEVWKSEHEDDVKRIEEQAKCEYENKDRTSYRKEFIEKQVKCEYENKDRTSEYRNRLNAMFKALFGYEYSKVLIGKKGSRSKYDIYDKGRDFLMFLLKTHSNKNGKILRSGKYEKNEDSYEDSDSELEREYENELLYYASQYLKERKEQEHDDNIKTEELSKIVMDKFGMGSGKIKMIEALIDFSNLINDLLETEKKDTPKLERVYADISEMINQTTIKGYAGIIENKKDITDKELEIAKQSIIACKELMEQINEYIAGGIDGLAQKIIYKLSLEYEDDILI